MKFTDEQIEAVMREVGLCPHGTWTPDEAKLALLILQARAERDLAIKEVGNIAAKLGRMEHERDEALERASYWEDRAECMCIENRETRMRVVDQALRALDAAEAKIDEAHAEIDLARFALENWPGDGDDE